MCGASISTEPNTRIVADVQNLASKTLSSEQNSQNDGAIAIIKHLCKDDTNVSIIVLYNKPLQDYIGTCCFILCCNQKTKRDVYCNMPYLESLGSYTTHVGLRGGFRMQILRIWAFLSP